MGRVRVALGGTTAALGLMLSQVMEENENSSQQEPREKVELHGIRLGGSRETGYQTLDRRKMLER